MSKANKQSHRKRDQSCYQRWGVDEGSQREHTCSCKINKYSGWNVHHAKYNQHRCQVASVVSDSVRPHRWQPTGSPIPGILQARILEWVAISFSSAWKWKVKVKSLSRIQLLATSWTAAYQAPPSTGFSRQEYWSGVPLPSPIINTAVCYVWKLFAE